jgi:NADH-quinone oxidoreductase subunit C
VLLDRNQPEVDTVSHIWPTANWLERECYDLLGVVFRGHPYLKRVLLPDDWVGWPLRKDYEEQPTYHGIPTTRPNPLELLQIGSAPEGSSEG